MNATVPFRLLGMASSVSRVNRVADVVETTSTTGEAPGPPRGCRFDPGRRGAFS